MILFKLKCSTGHEFEGWFRDGATFDRQNARGQVACPQCGSDEVDKAPMAPRPLRAAAAPSPDKTPPRAEDVRRALQVLRRHVESNCENVGPRFATEARAIHNGTGKTRGIYGDATPEESRALADDGIDFQTIPWVPPSDA
ncbi:MAG TPA: DUF1178 family protein [Stellaceae bacterium]|jgi:hypothetical protein|nr:DUF1178 family protein [Stellaceae bacterium]